MAGTYQFPDDVPTLVDGDVTLRAHKLSDVDAMVEQCVDPLSIRWTTVPVPFTRDDAVGYATKFVPASWADGTDLGFAIEAPHADGIPRFSGSVSLRPRGDGVAEVAFGLHPGARGRGVCRRAVALLVDWGFRTLGMEVVTWYAEVGNWASRRVVWAAGFSFDGMVPGLLLQRGERKDAWVGSLRATDDRSPKHPWNVPPVLETDRLRIRPFTLDDADRFAEMLFDDRTRHFGGRIRGIRELRSGEQALRRAWDATARGERYEWCIADRDTDRLVGHIQLFDLNGVDDTAVRPGYQIHPDSRGNGYLAEALSAVTDWVFRPATEGGLGRRRIIVATAESNIPSRRGAERAGYTLALIEPDSYPVGDDFEGTAVYHRVNPAWRVRADPV